MNIDVKKRDWVKNAAIVFLAVMLLLTFFSNTIMNRSLPEVAAQYTQSATITTRIRGSGTVTANEEYEVTEKRAYTVSSIPVKVGDFVETGDVLINLSKDASTELEEAEKELAEAELLLEKKLVSAEGSSFVDLYNAIASAQESIDEENRKLDRARDERKKAKETLDAISYDPAMYLSAKVQKDSAELTLEIARYNEEIAQRNLDTFVDTYVPHAGTTPPFSPDPEDDPEYNTPNTGLLAILNKTKNETKNAENKLAEVLRDTKFEALDRARIAWEEASSKYIEATDTVTRTEALVSSAERSLASAKSSLSLAQRSVGITNSLFDIEVREMKKDIEAIKEKIKELEESGALSEITAPVSGKITQININAGQDTIPDNPLILIEVIDRGYTLSIPVTAQQAARVNIGDMADIDRGWWSWGEPLTAILTNIRPDPQNPGGGRLLVFTVSGDDIESGSQLNVTIAQRSENYSIVVPNSAIRSDTNGDFVLIVETRSSPLRNRYVAVRVDVNVIASDDVNSAISGAGLGGWDFVITTSTRPIEPGMQVRLVDN